MSTPTLAQVVSALEVAYHPGIAQSWDRVGLTAGDPRQQVKLIHFAVDPTMEVVREAVTAGADLLVTHHPLLLRGIHSVATTSAKGALLTEAIVAGLALYSAHTNADSASPGVNTALATACGLDPTRAEPLSVAEGATLGLVGDLDPGITLGELAGRLADALPRTGGGIRVSGDPRSTVTRIALLGGAGDSLFEQVRAASADVYVTSDLRHHPASEAREEARGGTPFLIDAGHYATESMWLTGAAADLASALAASGHHVDTYVSTIVTDPWSFHVGGIDVAQFTAGRGAGDSSTG